MGDYNTQQPYIASYIILRKENKIAFVLRNKTSWMNGYYGLPSGKVEKDENFSQAAVREALEEVGVRIKLSDLKFVHLLQRFEPPGPNSLWVDAIFEADKYEGEPYNAEPEVHSELAWLDPKNLPENVIPSVKFLIEQIEAGNTYSEFGWASKT
jgi:8-oxo-dGTP diphosphatase